ncbi:acyl carrier protein [Aquimarina rhabdastrellae]
MKNETMIEQLKTIIKPYVENEEQWNNLNDETDFIKDLDINSANLVDIVLDIEDAFEIEIDNDAMEKMLNVKASIEVIKQKIAEK